MLLQESNVGNQTFLVVTYGELHNWQCKFSVQDLSINSKCWNETASFDFICLTEKERASPLSDIKWMKQDIISK